MNGLRDDSIQHMREEITDLAAGYGIDIMFTAMGMADVATLVDALTTLGELIGADKKRSVLSRKVFPRMG